MNTLKALLAAGFVASLWFPATATAQVATATPQPLQQSSNNVVVTFNADQGNGGLKNYTGDVYAHTGVITAASKDDSDWKHAPKWGDNDAKYKLTRVSTNKYTLSIGNISTYYGLTDGEEVKKLVFVFRNSDSSKEAKTASNSDITVNVAPEGFAMSFTSDATGELIASSTAVNFNLATSQNANLTIAVNGATLKTASNAKSLAASYSFTKAGDYAFTATAVNGSQTLTETLNYTYLGQPTAKAFPNGNPMEKMGAIKNADGSVTFCFAAPGKSNVVLVGSWDDYKVKAERQMYYTDVNNVRYFWTTVTGLDNTTYYPYYYFVDGQTKVGDPYARLVLDNNNDRSLKVPAPYPSYPYDRFNDTMLAVYCGSMDAYDWKHKNSFVMPNHGNLVIYELLLRDFTGKDSRADGTLAEAIKKIPYLKELGVNAVELMPIMEFNGNNSWGYNTNFYFAPDKAYGTPDEYREFIDLCHANGIAVILDIVLNHADGLHPWYRMYPVASNPFFNASAPHDWSVLNDWKQEHPLVEQQWKDALQYWLTAYDVDGFRFDLVKGLGDSDSYKSGTDAYNSSRSQRMQRLHGYIKEVKPNAVHINEGFLSTKEEGETGANGQLNWANVNNGSCQTAMGYMSNASLNAFYAPSASRDWGTTVSYAESHDEERMGYKNIKYGHASVKNDHVTSMKRLGIVAAEMLFAPGAHMIWQFQELGADQTTKDANGGNNTNPKKVVWSYLDDPDRHALMETYRTMAHFRKDNPRLYAKGAETKIAFSGWTQGRTARITSGNQEAVLLVNPHTDNAVDVTVDVTKLNASNFKTIASTPGINVSPKFNGNNVTVTLPTGTFVLLATTNTAGIDSIGIGDEAGDTPAAYAYGSNGRIVIEGEYNRADVYNMAGRQVGLENLAAGVYVVNIDGNASKVIVR